MQIRSVLTLGIVLIWCCGCGPRIVDERDVSLEVGDIKSILFGPFKNELTATVSVSSPGAPISAYVFASDQQEHVDYAITYSKEPQNTWAGVASTEDVTLTAVVPAGQEAVVRLQTVDRKAAQVHLNISE
jgi:hypothetical protein